MVLLAFYLCAWAQKVMKPKIILRNDISFNITEIELTPEYTIIKGFYENVGGYGWVNINKTAFINNSKSGKVYGKIVKSEGLPISPKKHKFKEDDDDIVPFKLYFPPINDNADQIDFVEDKTSSFNCYGIILREESEEIIKENEIKGFQKKEDRNIFSVSYRAGYKQEHKPSLSSRINGVKEVQVYVPTSSTDMTDYVFGNITSYLKGLGLKVDVIKTKYNNKNVQVRSVIGNYKYFDDDISNYLKNANTLGVVASVLQSVGQYTSQSTVTIEFIDYVNEAVWKIPQFDIPKNYDKFQKTLKQYITNTYSFNSEFSYIPPTFESTWKMNDMKEYLETNSYNPLEGIYKGDKYTVGIKKGNDGKYYMIYHTGADNLEDWKDGYVKAILTQSSTPTIFEAAWFGKWKHKIDYTISFINGAFVAINPDNEQETFIKLFPDMQTIVHNGASSGTGFFFNKSGYIITNYHVIENAQNGNIKITGINEDYHKMYKAQVEVTDKQNDLAIIKITDPLFKSIATIPYTFKFNTSNVGEECFVLGYPLISSMGKDIKLTTGIISSKTGFDGNIAQYQISAPIQPGNSGGPLFDKKGNVIGIVQAKHTQAENAGYAIKASYIRNLIELLPTTVILPQNNLLNGKTLPQQVEQASKSVCLIIVNGSD